MQCCILENIASNKVIQKCGGKLFDTEEETIKNNQVKINCYYVEMNDFNISS